MPEPIRPQPLLPSAARKTYSIVGGKVPMRRAACDEVDCPNYLRGWVTRLDETTPQGQYLGKLARQSGRRFLEEREGVLTVLRFSAGQECFGATEHELPVDVRPAVYLVKGGDWRGNPLGVPTLRHSGASAWVSDFGEHQEKLADKAQEG
jgi:hypothetical protein